MKTSITTPRSNAQLVSRAVSVTGFPTYGELSRHAETKPVLAGLLEKMRVACLEYHAKLTLIAQKSRKHLIRSAKHCLCRFCIVRAALMKKLKPVFDRWTKVSSAISFSGTVGSIHRFAEDIVAGYRGKQIVR